AIYRAGKYRRNAAGRTGAQLSQCVLSLQQLRVVQSGERVSRFARHDYFPGIQEPAARSDFQKTARTVGARTDSAKGRDCKALQGFASKRADGVAGRSDVASENAVRGYRLFRIENECDLRARVVKRANRGADHSRAHRTASARTLSGGVSSKDPHRGKKLSADRTGLLGFVRTVCA